MSQSNVLWGNFIPFKNLVIDEQSFVKALTSQTQIINQNAEIEEKLRKLSDLNKKSITFKAVNILDKGTDTSSGFANISVEADKLSANIEETIKSIVEKIKQQIQKKCLIIFILQIQNLMIASLHLMLPIED